MSIREDSQPGLPPGPAHASRRGFGTVSWRAGASVVVLAAAMVAAYSRPAALPTTTPDQPLLPVLVGYGEDGGISESSVTIRLEAGPNGADSLFGHFSNAAYVANDLPALAGRPARATFDLSNLGDLSLQARRDDAACVRFTVGDAAGPWLCDWNDNPAVSVPWRERTAGGFGGWYSNVRATFALPAPVRAGGTLTAEFRWNGTEGLRSGYRVFDLDLVGGTAGAGQLATPFTVLEPAPFTTHRDSLAAGRALWFQRDVLSDFGPNGDYRRVVASCNDCHVSGGRDLWRFRYEEDVIVARGRFHGLTKEQSRNVASYVLSLDLAPETAEGCRPWNPPFQPGTGLDDLPVGGWICGAGADAMLEADHLMAPYLYPTGFHPDSIRALYGGARGNDWRLPINRREMPIPHQLPVWNGWLPRISLPDLALDWAAECRSNNTLCYETGDLGLRDEAGPHGPAWGRWADAFATPEARAARVAAQRRWFEGTSGGVTHEYYLRQNGTAELPRKPEYADAGFWQQIANQSQHQTLAVRLFDVMTNRSALPWNSVHGEAETAWEIANDMACEIPNTPRYPFTWRDGSMLIGPSAPGTGSGRTSCAEVRGGTAAQMDWTYFAVSTHISARDGTGGPWDYPSLHAPAVGVLNRNGFDGAIWYELAAILEAPGRFTNPGAPSDWNYVVPHTMGASRPGSPGSILSHATGIVMLQLMQGPLPVPHTWGNWKGWHLHHAMHIRWLYHPDLWRETAQRLGEEAAAGIQAGLAEAWLDWSERYPASAWDEVRGTEYAQLDPRGATFAAPGDPHPGEWMTPGQYVMHWTVLLDRMGARRSTVDRMARFGAGLFDTPSGFAAYFCETPGCGGAAMGYPGSP